MHVKLIPNQSGLVARIDKEFQFQFQLFVLTLSAMLMFANFLGFSCLIFGLQWQISKGSGNGHWKKINPEGGIEISNKRNCAMFALEFIFPEKASSIKVSVKLSLN